MTLMRDFALCYGKSEWPKHDESELLEAFGGLTVPCRQDATYIPRPDAGKSCGCYACTMKYNHVA